MRHTRLHDWYYLFLIKHEEAIDVLKDKLFEFLVKLPIVLFIQFIFWELGKIMYGGVHFYASVYEFVYLSGFYTVGLLLQGIVYYFLFEPFLEFIIVVKEKGFGSRNT